MELIEKQIGRIGNYAVWSTYSKNDMDLVRYTGEVVMVRFEKSHFGFSWVVCNQHGRWATLFDLVHDLP